MKIAMRNGIYGAEEEYAKLPEEVKRVCSVSDIRDWAKDVYKRQHLSRSL